MEVSDEVRGLEKHQAESSEDTANAVCGKETANDRGQQHPETAADVVLDIEQYSKNEDETRTQSWQTLSELLDRLIVALTPGYSKARDHEEESSRRIDDVIEITTAITELNEPDLSEESKKANTERLVMEKGEMLPLISVFMKQLYSSHMNGVEMLCLICIQNCLILWSHYSLAVCRAIMVENIFFSLFKQLVDLPFAHISRGPGQQLLSAIISTTLTVLLNCIERIELHCHFESCNITEFIIPYVKSSEYSIATTAKVCLALLYKQLDPTQASQYVRLTSLEVKAIAQNLSGEKIGEESSECESMRYWGSLSTKEVAYVLKHFISVDENCQMLANHQAAVCKALQCLFQSKDGSLQELSLEILWRFLLSTTSLQCSSELSEVPALLQVVSSSSPPELETLSSCVLLAAKRDLPEDATVYLKYIRASYKHELYNECIRICDSTLTKPFEHQPSLQNHADLYKGKALCQLFSRELLPLQRMSSSASGYHQKRKSCFGKVKQAIHCLGSAHDNDCIDQEGSKFLDFAMMLILPEPGNLKGLRRCLLCHGSGKLMRSHICPKAVLDDFAKAAGTPDSHKAFFLSWPWQKHLTGYLKSPGEMTIWMLCATCESILSKDESLFLPQFFRKIYDKTSPSRISEEQEIQYDRWLYRFCAGLLFRGIALQYSEGWESYINAPEVHDMFYQIRAVLLATDIHSEVQVPPVISLFLLPFEADSSEVDSVLINSVIHYVFHFFFTHKQVLYSSHQLYKRKLFFSFKLGVIMTTVQFPSATDYPVPSEHRVQDKGVFKVPVAADRRQTFPDAIWQTLLVEATQLEKEIAEQPQRMTRIPMERLLCVPATSYMVDILSIATQNRCFGQASPVSGAPKIVNFLPQVIEIKHHLARFPSGSLDLPEGHKVLLHLDIQNDNGIGNTVFLAIGSESAKYCPQNPYIIFHHYEAGLQHNIGFHFSPESYTFVNLLPDAVPKRYTETNVQKLIEQSEKIVAAVLTHRGFRCYQSLEHWEKSNKATWSLDRKCKGENLCWYCSHLCEVCMQSTNFGPSVNSTSANGAPLRFCSNECAQKYTSTPEPHADVFTPQKQESGTMNVPSGHKEYLHLYTYGQLEGESFIASMSVCEGDGSPTFPAGRFYVMFRKQTEQSQCHLEFFINDDLQPAETILYPNQPGTLFEDQEEADIKTSVMDIIHDIFKRSHCSTFSEFLALLPISEALKELSDSLSGTIFLPRSLPLPSAPSVKDLQESSSVDSQPSAGNQIPAGIVPDSHLEEPSDQVGSGENSSDPAASVLLQQQLYQLLAGALAQTTKSDADMCESPNDNKHAPELVHADLSSHAAVTEVQDPPALIRLQQQLQQLLLAQISSESSVDQRSAHQDDKTATTQVPKETELDASKTVDAEPSSDNDSNRNEVEADSIELPKNEDESPCLVS